MHTISSGNRAGAISATPPTRRRRELHRLKQSIGLLTIAISAYAGTGCDSDVEPERDAVLQNESASSTSRRFTLIQVPDTQYAVQKWPALYTAEMKWIANNVSSKNIRFVVHVGDLQEWPAHADKWSTAIKGLDLIHGKVPYVVAIGNHDFDAWAGKPGSDHHAAIAANRATKLFNQHLPRSRFASLPQFGGTFPAASNDNSYHYFTAADTNWLVLTLKYRPTDAELAWARSVVEQHPGHQVIVNTHEYQTGSTRTSTGDRLWDGLVRIYPNIALVLSGHLTTRGRRVDKGDHGNSVVQIVADYQAEKERDLNGYLRIMEFDAEAQTLSVKTYSPALGREMVDDVNQFILTDFPFKPPVQTAPRSGVPAEEEIAPSADGGD
jgi:hypothetical protein